MSMAERAWRDSQENYCDGYTLKVNGSTATALLGNSYKQPLALYGLSISCNTAVGSGMVDLIDSSATGDADSTIWSVAFASGNVGPYNYVKTFSRGLVFNNGLVVTATTVTGSISLLYKART